MHKYSAVFSGRDSENRFILEDIINESTSQPFRDHCWCTIHPMSVNNAKTIANNQADINRYNFAADSYEYEPGKFSLTGVTDIKRITFVPYVPTNVSIHRKSSTVTINLTYDKVSNQLIKYLDKQITSYSGPLWHQYSIDVLLGGTVIIQLNSNSVKTATELKSLLVTNSKPSYEHIYQALTMKRKPKHVKLNKVTPTKPTAITVLVGLPKSTIKIFKQYNDVSGIKLVGGYIHRDILALQNNKIQVTLDVKGNIYRTADNLCIPIAYTTVVTERIYATLHTQRAMLQGNFIGIVGSRIDAVVNGQGLTIEPSWIKRDGERLEVVLHNNEYYCITDTEYNTALCESLITITKEQS